MSVCEGLLFLIVSAYFEWVIFNVHFLSQLFYFHFIEWLYYNVRK